MLNQTRFIIRVSNFKGQVALMPMNMCETHWPNKYFNITSVPVHTEWLSDLSVPFSLNARRSYTFKSSNLADNYTLL